MIKFLNENNILIILCFTYSLLLLVKVIPCTNLLILPIIGFCLIEYFITNKYYKYLKIEAEEKETFVASVLHDLKNPLIGQIRILEGFLKKKEYLNENSTIKMLLGSNKNMFEMVMSVLNTYKYSKGKIQYDFEVCNLVELVSEVTEELISYTDEEKNLVMNIRNKNLYILADKLHLKRVISNLIANAIKYKKEDTAIVVNLSIEKEFCKFSVTNQGYYIEPKVQEKLFDKYISQNSKFNKISTGLGLYLSKRIVTEHNGNIALHSTIKGINTFSFMLPRTTLEKSGNNIPQGNLRHQTGESEISKLYQT